jgi:SOS-response transcriptional repressor LexA
MHDTTRRLYEVARVRLGITTLSEVAVAIGETAQTLKNWETRGVSQRGQINAARRLGCDAEYIANGTGNIQSTKQNVTSVHVRSTVPLISWVQAGPLTEVQDVFSPGEADEMVESFDQTLSGNAFALRVENDSMVSPYPGDLSFPEGTILIVDPNRTCDAGDYVIAKDVHTQRATFKKLMTDGGRWFLKPLNPVYPTQEIDDPAMRIIGRVVESQTRRKL